MSDRPKTLREYLAPHGRVAALARAIGCTHAAIRQWNPDRIPAERVLEVERITGCSRHVLRPDLYPREDAIA